MEKILEDTKKEILAQTKDVELIFVSGSYAFGTMQKHSDIDMKVLTGTKPKKHRAFRFVEFDGRKILLAIHFDRLSHVLREIRSPKEWVWDYEYYRRAVVLFDKNQNLEKIKEELERHRVHSEYFHRFIPEEASYLPEYVGKLKNAYSEKDELNILYSARTIAKICHNLLKPFNPVWRYVSETETYSSFIELRDKPKNYVADFKICYGLTTEKRPIDVIYRSAMRLARETTNFVKKNMAETKIKDKEFLRFFKSKEYTDFLR